MTTSGGGDEVVSITTATNTELVTILVVLYCIAIAVGIFGIALLVLNVVLLRLTWHIPKHTSKTQEVPVVDTNVSLTGLWEKALNNTNSVLVLAPQHSGDTNLSLGGYWKKALNINPGRPPY